MQQDPAQIIKDKRLLALYRYWASKRGDRTMPARADIDPTEIPALLPIIVLIDIVGIGDYRYRLAGTEIVRNFGRDMTGKTFAEVLPGGAYAEYITGLVNDVVSTGRALYSEGVFTAEGHIDRQVRRLALPLSADGRVVDMLLVGQTVIVTSKAALGGGIAADLLFSEGTRVFLT